MCKHMLAVQLARAMDACHEVSVSDEEFAELLSSDSQQLQEYDQFTCFSKLACTGPSASAGSDDPSQQERWQFSEGKCVKVYLNYDLNDL